MVQSVLLVEKSVVCEVAEGWKDEEEIDGERERRYMSSGCNTSGNLDV